MDENLHRHIKVSIKDCRVIDLAFDWHRWYPPFCNLEPWLPKYSAVLAAPGHVIFCEAVPVPIKSCDQSGCPQNRSRRDGLHLICSIQPAAQSGAAPLCCAAERLSYAKHSLPRLEIKSPQFRTFPLSFPESPVP
jgi:hypothetical protein